MTFSIETRYSDKNAGVKLDFIYWELSGFLKVDVKYHNRAKPNANLLKLLSRLLNTLCSLNDVRDIVVSEQNEQIITF